MQLKRKYKELHRKMNLKSQSLNTKMLCFGIRSQNVIAMVMSLGESAVPPKNNKNLFSVHLTVRK